MKTSEKFEALLCNPDGAVCIHGSDEDRKILTEAIAEVRVMETENKLSQDGIQGILDEMDMRAKATNNPDAMIIWRKKLVALLEEMKNE